MLKKISFALFSAVTFLSAPANATMTHVLQKGLTIEYDFPANEPQLFVNYLFWTVEANCKMISEDESDDLFVEGLAKKGKINDINLSSGQSMMVTVHSGDNLKISADSGAKVQITNQGEHNIHAICTA